MTCVALSVQDARRDSARMPKKETGRKVPMNKKQRQAMKRTVTGFNAAEGAGEKGFWALLFGRKGK